MNDPLPVGASPRLPEPRLVSYTHWMYALHALAAFIGIVSSAAVALQFVFGIPSIIAIARLSGMRRKPTPAMSVGTSAV